MPRAHVPETGWTPIQANGLTHAAFIEGEGPLVILQHGFPDTPHTWDALAPRLVEAGYRVVRPFGRGIAPSEIPAGDAYTAEDISGDLIAIIEALGEDTATLIGHDWGASAVWGAAHMAPERIERLIAVAIPHPVVVQPTLGKVWGARHFLSLRLPGAVGRFAKGDFATLRALYERWSPGFDWPDSEFEAAKNAYSAPGSLNAALGYYRCLALWPWRGRVKVDALVLGGETDGVATESDFMACPKRVDGACEVKMLPGGHFLHREHPEPFIEAVLDYLQRSTSGS